MVFDHPDRRRSVLGSRRRMAKRQGDKCRQPHHRQPHRQWSHHESFPAVMTPCHAARSTCGASTQHAIMRSVSVLLHRFAPPEAMQAVATGAVDLILQT